MAEKKDKPGNVTEEKGRLPITQHFTEMRQRFIRSIVGIVIGTVLSMFFGDQLVLLLLQPAGELADNVQAIDVLEYISVYFRVALTAGFILSMPWILYQFFAFLMPAFTPREKRALYTGFPFIVGLFLAGVAFAYFLALPVTMYFLFEFGSEIVTVAPRISTYIDLVLRLLVSIGLAFEMPIILGALSIAGIVNSKWLASKRKIWIVLAFIISAFITPTLDPITQSLIAAPLIVLYEISIWLTRIIGRRKPPAVASS